MRNFLKRKAFALINLLAWLPVWLSFMLVLYIQNELGYDIFRNGVIRFTVWRWKENIPVEVHSEVAFLNRSDKR